jgi:hypothetical protein
VLSTSTLAASTIEPYFTPAGQAVSHAWQSKQKFISSAKMGVISISPRATDLMSLILPRGDDLSFFVISYVGQTARHIPQ